MTPGARVQAAIEILDRVLRGASAERELTSWGRARRYAGSGDRAAVRDHVFDALRRLRSAAWHGGCGDVAPEAMEARSVMAGLLLGQGTDPATLFTGSGHAPAPLDPLPDPGPMPEAVALDVPDWLLEMAGEDPASRLAFAAQRDRAPVFLRVNLARGSRDALIAVLAEAGHPATADPLSPTAVRLAGPVRGLTTLPAFLDGWFEMQDAGSQAVVDALPIRPGERILDLCAGGGGKTLAMAARGAHPIFAHDADPARMRDLPARAARAGVEVHRIETPEEHVPFDAVLADVPCSGSGTWRRSPEAKWRITRQDLEALQDMQGAILARALRLVRPGGWIGYVTCSILPEENEQRVRSSLDGGGAEIVTERRLKPEAGGADGFYVVVLRRTSGGQAVAVPGPPSGN